LGWRIHRIWSTEWFNKPKSEVERVLEAVQKVRAGLLCPRYVGTAVEATPLVPTQPPASEPIDKPEVVSDLIGGVEPYKCFVPPRTRSSDAFYVDSTQTVAELVRKVVAVEGPIHEEELARRIAGCYGMSRVGHKIGARVRQATEYALMHHGILCRGEFLWSVSMVEPSVRSRGDNGPRNIELICPEEMGRASRLLLKAQFGMNRRDLVVQTARVLGFNNTGGNIAAAIEAALEQEITGGRIRADADSLIAT
jgi:hypothetical protein